MYDECMGQREQESKKRAQRHQIQKIVLETIKAAGILSIAVVAPKVLAAMVKIGLIPHKRQNEIVRKSIDRLYEQDLLRHTSQGLTLTRKGEEQLKKFESKSFHPPRYPRWDQKWRVLVFDIPERRRRLRDFMRRTLHGNGFIRLQDSVWVYPYDCEDWVNLWKADLKIGKELLYMIVDSIEGDSVLKRQFGI